MITYFKPSGQKKRSDLIIPHLYSVKENISLSFDSPHHYGRTELKNCMELSRSEKNAGNLKTNDYFYLLFKNNYLG